MNPGQLHNLLKALGQDVISVDSDGNVQSAQGATLDRALIDPLIAAHDKPLADSTNTSLRDYLGGDTDPRWIAYSQELRRQIREAREARFRESTDAVFAKSFELAEGARDVTIGQVVYRLPTAAKIKAWEDRKTAIRAELKYPDEE